MKGRHAPEVHQTIGGWMIDGVRHVPLPDAGVLIALHKPHIGMPLWWFNQSRRRYTKPAPGRAYGELIWREHWEPTFIIGETRVSWLVGPDWMLKDKRYHRQADRLPKRDFPGAFAISEEDIDRKAWIHDNRLTLGDRVWKCHDYGTLKAIEALLVQVGA